MGRSARALLLAILLCPPASAAEPDTIDASGAGPGRTLLRRGTDQLIGGEAAAAAPIPGGPVSLNLVEVPVAVAAKAVLADTLGWGYTIDERVTGSLTLQTGGPVRREALLSLFETALASRGALLRRRPGSAQILPAGAPGGLNPVRRLADAAEAAPGAHAVPLRWISAVEMQAILAAVAPREVVLRADRARNLLILSGDAAQIQALRQTIAVFDVDWMRGMSTAILPVRSANPAAIARDLTQIFAGEATASGDIIRFVPNEPLSAILVVSARAAYLDRAREWVARLEDLAAERERQLFVYRIQNRSAKELAAVLQGVVAAETGANVSTGQGYGTAGFGGAGSPGAFGGTNGAGPAYGGSPLGGQTGLGTGGFGAGPDSAGLGGAGGLAGTPALRGADGLGGAGAMQGGFGSGPAGFEAGAVGAVSAGYGTDAGYGAAGVGGRRDQIGIVADEANNSLVVSATRNQYDKILKILGRLDAMPTQVLLETVIAEVTLNDSLEFGVQWFLKNGGSRLNLAQAATVGAASAATGGAAGLITAAARGVQGFNYLLNNADFNVVLNALRGVTRVNVISSPNITVLDNRTAKLQIGDQVPIVKQTGQSALAGNAPILNQIEMKDTGVILSVTPRVNKNGLVVLDINQEVSDVVPTTTSAINSPTIRQRRVATSVAVNDGHSLAIGGLVQEKVQIGSESVPLLGDLPLVGAAFRNRIDARLRTELIVFIRPKVIRGTADADRIASDFREQFRAMMPIRPVPAPPPLAEVPPGGHGLLRRMID
ncbi:type II secretion system secretin GspD [Methylobacterium durans]|uniref:type II secretion system secretin GspD n=1 Tax=Methylobacterium durans TaxID=2202825 RepID=UPI002AFEDF88|nr:type II secretion system secretin GspD [Methylobacterium durans]MEA1832126.1 type II secretion system secretin GspD [Methylobacterium durans]